MVRSELNTGITLFRELADGRKPGQIITKGNAFSYALVKKHNWPYVKANLMANLLITSGYVEFKDGFLFLTEHGYDLAHDEVPALFTPDLRALVDCNNREKAFYDLWDIIGNDKDLNPLYIGGSSYYNAIRPFLTGVPHSYSEYIADIKNTSRSSSRSKWCRELFMDLGELDLPAFLDKLSEILQRRADAMRNVDDIDDEIDDLSDREFRIEVFNNGKSMESQPNRTKKVFISHNTEDKAYAKALVDLLLKMGVDKDDIFCSSYPGLGVKFGQSFIDAIKSQYENHDLIILFIHSPRFYRSPVSLCEMGAGWIAKKSHLSFLTNDCGFNDLKGVVLSTEIAFKAGDENTYHVLNDFKKMIVDGFNLRSIDDTMWDVMRDDFKSTVESL